LRHVVWMIILAALTAAVFGATAKGTARQRALYGLKVFGEFILIGLALGWLLYFVPLW
jgi:hypothetical protein